MDMVPDKRERILQAASRLIVRNGLQCSMSAIAEEAGVATGSLYNYFESKEALVSGVYRRVAEQMIERLSLADAGKTDKERVRLYIDSYIDFIWEDALRAKLFDYLDNIPLMSLQEAKAIFGDYVAHGNAMLEDAQAAGVVRAGPASLMASFLRGSIRNSLKRRRLVADPLSSEERQLIAAMCWDAIAA